MRIKIFKNGEKILFTKQCKLTNLSRQKAKNVYLCSFIINLIIVDRKSFFYKDLPDLNNLIIKS